MSNLTNIREELFECSAKRIIIRVKTETRNSEDCRTTAYRTVNEIFPNWERDNRVLFLAIQVWADRIFMIIDVNHANYNYQVAHKDKTILPVYVLRTHRGNWVLMRWSTDDERVAMELAELHRVAGYSATIPFFENHNSQTVYDNPRESPQ